MPASSVPAKKQQVRGLVALLLAMLLIPVPVLLRGPAPARAAEVGQETPRGSQAASLTVTMAKPAPTVAPTGTLEVAVTSAVKVPVDTLSVRLRLRRPSGRLLYQRTVEREELKAGATSVVQFKRDLENLDLREGRYRIDVRVTADRLPAVELTDSLYLVRPERRPIPLVVVTRFSQPPMTDAEGRFVLDPATTTASRDELTALMSLLDRMPALRLTLGVTPVMLDEWRRVTSGYRFVAPEGVRTVEDGAPATVAYASALATLRRAAENPRLEVLDVPFADPDLAGLRSIGANEDLARHFERGLSIYQASLGTTPSAGVAVAGDSIPSSALPALTAEGVDRMLLRPNALQVSRAATQAPGLYAIRDTGMKALLLDDRASYLLGDRRAKREALLDYLFSRLISEEGGRPVAVSVPLGPGSRTDVATLEAVLRDLSRTGWVTFRTSAEAAQARPSATGRLRSIAYPGRPAPSGYWPQIRRGREYAYSFLSAVSERDPDAMDAVRAALIAESRLWAGPDSSWSFADRGQSFAAAAQRSSAEVLDKVSMTSQPITLSGSDGKVPVTIKNGSGKTLHVELVAAAPRTRFPDGSHVKTTLRPGDNYVTLPVDLGAGGVYDRLELAVVSGTLTVASTSLEVRASYLDRIALVAMVVLVLLGLLFYIRRKVRRATADT